MANKVRNASYRPFIFTKREDIFALRAEHEKIARELSERECEEIGGGKPPRTPPTGIGSPNSTTCYTNTNSFWPKRSLCLADDPRVDFN